METKGHSIFIEVDSNTGYVMDIFSTVFREPGASSILIGQGLGDKYVHAHLYLGKELQDEDGAYNFIYKDGQVVERTPEDKVSYPTVIAPSIDQEKIAMAQAIVDISTDDMSSDLKGYLTVCYAILVEGETYNIEPEIGSNKPSVPEKYREEVAIYLAMKG